MRLLVATVILLSMACARTPTPMRKVELPAPGPLAEAWLLPKRILDTETQQEIAEEELWQALVTKRVVYVGEKHPSHHDHAVQLRVIDQLHRLDPSLGIGLEMVKRPFQKWLNDYVAGDIDESAFIDNVQWAKRWGFDFQLYRPILEYARLHKLPVYALNARDEITRSVARTGIEGLDEADRKALPELDLKNEEHRERIQKVFDEHGMGEDGPHGKMSFDNFYAAQVIWDETMAHEIAAELSKPGAPNRVVVLAGTGHVRRALGIPSRAARRGAKPYSVVYPMRATAEEATASMEEKLGDFLWVMPPQPSEDKD